MNREIWRNTAKCDITKLRILVKTKIILSYIKVRYSRYWTAKSINALNSKFLCISAKVASRVPMWRRESRSKGTKLDPKSFEFGAFIDPLAKIICITPQVSQIWDMPKNVFFVKDPFYNHLDYQLLSSTSRIITKFEIIKKLVELLNGSDLNFMIWQVHCSSVKSNMRRLCLNLLSF